MDETQAQTLLETVKVDKGVTDNSLDPILTNFIKQASDMVCLYVGEDSLPSVLEVIVIRVTEAHYVQSMTDADGAKSYSEEGASWTFQNNELSPYLDLLQQYTANKTSGGSSKGAVYSW